MEDRSEEINQLNLPFLDKMEIKDNVRILRLKGVMDHDTLPKILKIREELTTGHDRNALNILLDFEKVTDVDSSAIAVLSVRLDELKENQHVMGLINVPEKLSSLLDIFKESSHFQLFDSEQKALEDLKLDY